ncbi:general secretion pathway protein GspB [Massilia sp. 9096]|uniref:general secretion pathway protein GspB n=1 Tax=Massilia sp. 9096 TaxID=1500894 RepID=UPI00055C00DE|nr:general secretion pathway protein GspB [Massilia sp. 9096]
MSYILEALKKAQAERQLGNAPTIHAPQPVQASAAAGNELAGSRKPLLLGVGAGVVVALAGAALLWHRAPAPGVQVAQAPQAVAAAPSAASSAPSSTTSSAMHPAPSAAGGTAAATLAVRAPESLPAPLSAPPRAAQTRAGAPASPPAGAVGGADARNAAPAPVNAAPAPLQAQAAPAAPVSAPAAAAEGSLPLLQQLPESVRAQIPRVSFGGYMYSANPADRLVLVDKGLRHEGEEVGPGLVLEKLLPHAAVMNFRGVRYRVAY